MRKLKDLVAPLELCKMIPAGMFTDTYFVWAQKMRHKSEKNHHWISVGDPVVIPRSELCHLEWDFISPAPTLAEIMDALPASTAYKLGQTWTVALCNSGIEVSGDCVKNRRPATAALKLWLEVNGMEVEK